jgi:tRNA A37 threonylcarbamoyladenosine synthetase subunit TsaC/SUA5/YrdC
MARYLDVHPDNPQPRLLQQVVDALHDDALIAYPTDSGYALGCRVGNRDGRDRILNIRGLDDRHHFTLVCRDFSQLGQPRRLMHPKKRTVGVRIPDHGVVRAILDLLGEPLLSSSLILPGETEPRTMGWEIKEELDHRVDIVVEAGETPAVPTTVIDWSEGYPEMVRRGAGDPDRFV